LLYQLFVCIWTVNDNFFVCFRAVERKTDVAVNESLPGSADAASQTDEILIRREHLFRKSFKWMLYQFLVHAIDMKRGNLIDRLVTKDVLTSGERQRIKEQKSTSVRLNSLLMMMREKTEAEFESFLLALSDAGQPSVADVVRQTLHTIGQAGQNPLHISDGNIVFFIIIIPVIDL